MIRDSEITNQIANHESQITNCRITNGDVFRQDPDPPQGVRLADSRPVDRRDRRDGQADGCPAGWADPSPDGDQQVDGASVAARGQEVARAVRDSNPQAAD